MKKNKNIQNKEQANTRKTGSLYEKKAQEYLKKQGLVILERNFRCRMGEIDLIAKEGEYYVFVEVKYRGTLHSGDPFGAVDRKKQHTISKTAKWYLMTHCHSVEVPCRFDVIGFEGENLRWIKNAFEYLG